MPLVRPCGQAAAIDDRIGGEDSVLGPLGIVQDG